MGIESATSGPGGWSVATKLQKPDLAPEAFSELPEVDFSPAALSLEALAESKDKLVLEAIQKSVRNAELLDLEIMIKSVELLSKHGDSETISALVSGLKKSESKILNLRKVIVDAIGENGSDDHIITLLDLYEIRISPSQ